MATKGKKRKGARKRKRKGTRKAKTTTLRGVSRSVTAPIKRLTRRVR